MEKALWYIFVLSLVLVALAYYVGLTSDLPVIKDALVSLVYALTGRDNKGQYPGYPKAA